MTEAVSEEVVQGEVIDFPSSEALEKAEYHTILEVWVEVLKHARTEKDAAITPGWANRICTSYQQITFKDVPAFQQQYFGNVIQLFEILEQEIEGDDKCLKRTEAKEDAEENGHHYKNLIMQWQLAILQWELEWDCASESAAVELAAIAEAQKMFFGEVGILGYLDNIGFEFTDADQELLGEALGELQRSNSE